MPPTRPIRDVTTFELAPLRIPRVDTRRAASPRWTARWWTSRGIKLVAAATVAVGLATLALPLLHDGFPFGHDLSAHLTYTYLFDRAFSAGQFPVRWTQGVRIGDSQPLFSFYQPGFYYLVQLTHGVVPSLAASLKITIAVLWACGALFMARAGSRRGWMPAALAAMVFAGAPYVLLDVNVRAAYPELAAIVFAVGVLWAIARLLASPGPGRAVCLAGLLAASLVCHLPATLIFCPVFVGRALVSLAASRARRSGLGWCAAAVVLAAGIAAFYVVPALGERDLIRMSALTQDYLDYRNHFVAPAQWVLYSWRFGKSVLGPADGMSFQVGQVQWSLIVAAIGCSVATARRRRLTRADWDLVFWVGVVAVALFMTTSASSPLWQALPALAYLQFPWRFLMLVAVACGFLASNLLARVRGSTRRAALLAALVVLQFIASPHQRRLDHYVAHADMDIDRPAWSETESAKKMAFVEPGYFPKGGSDADDADAAKTPVPRWLASDARARVTPRELADHRIQLEVSSDAGTDVVLATRLFPGWTASIDGRATMVAAEPVHGFMRVQVPPGRHSMTSELQDTGLRRSANVVSAASLALVGVLVAASVRGRRR